MTGKADGETMKDKIRILAVAPYRGLKQLILSMADQYEDYIIDVVEGDLEAGLALIRQLEPNTYDIILSRGGTAALLKRNTDIPVINIGISGYDILRLIKLAQNYSERVMIIGFEPITWGCRSICELLQINMDIYTISQEQEVEPLLKELQQQGDFVVIGDVITTETAARLGLKNMLVTSGEESVQQALKEVGRYVRYMRKNRQRASLLEQVLSEAPEPVLILGPDGKLIDFFGPQDVREELVQRLQGQVASTMQSGQRSMVIKSIAGVRYHVLGKVVESDDDKPAAVAFYIRKAAPLSYDMAVTVLNTEDIDKSKFGIFSSVNKQQKEALEQISLLTGTDVSILLEGENGTGKATLAEMIHCNSRLAYSVLVSVDCAWLSDEDLYDLLKNGLEPILQREKCTVFFRQIDKLSSEGQNKLLRYLPQLKLHRIIASSDRSLYAMVQENEFSSGLYAAFSFTRIWLPPLRERTEDMEALFHFIIIKVNTQLGKQIVGIEKPALKLLMEYDWVGNTEQFAQVIIDAANLERGPYISQKIISSLLSAQNQAKWSKDRYAGRTLDGMEKDIILAALHEADMNQSLAAKRLGISRTTLWRKLKG